MAAILPNAQFDVHALSRVVGTAFPGASGAEEYSCSYQILYVADRPAAFQTDKGVGPPTFTGGSDYQVLFDGDGGVSNNAAIGDNGSDTYDEQTSGIPDGSLEGGAGFVSATGIWYRRAYRRRKLAPNSYEQIFWFDLGNGLAKISRAATTALVWTAAHEFWISNNPWASAQEGANCKIRAFKLWSVGQSESDLQAESAYSSIVTLNGASNIWARWPLVSDANDVSGNARHLTAQGTVTFDGVDILPTSYVIGAARPVSRYTGSLVQRFRFRPPPLALLGGVIADPPGLVVQPAVIANPRVGPPVLRRSRKLIELPSPPPTITASVLTAAGDASASFTGQSTAASALSAPGDSAATFVGASTAGAVLSSSGDASATFVGKSTAASVLNAPGDASASFVGRSTAAGVLSAPADATGTFVGISQAASAFSAAGDATAAFVAFAPGSVLGAAGDATATFLGQSLARGVFTAAGEAFAQFRSPAAPSAHRRAQAWPFTLTLPSFSGRSSWLNS